MKAWQTTETHNYIHTFREQTAHANDYITDIKKREKKA